MAAVALTSGAVMFVTVVIDGANVVPEALRSGTEMPTDVELSPRIPDVPSSCRMRKPSSCWSLSTAVAWRSSSKDMVS